MDEFYSKHDYLLWYKKNDNHEDKGEQNDWSYANVFAKRILSLERPKQSNKLTLIVLSVLSL